MKLCSLLVSLLLGTAYACSDHDHHHHHHNDDLPEEHRHLQATLDALECEAILPSPGEKLAASKVMVDFKKHARHSRGLQSSGAKVYQIPVTFHIIRTDSGEKDVSDSQIDQYLAYLNDHFEGTPFTFVKNLVNRLNRSDWHFCDYNVHYEMGQQIRVGGIADLNVYFCSITTGAGGWAYYPSSAGQYWDGMVVESDYTKYGFPSSYVRRTILPHEAGHWFGLFHTFQDECDSVFTTENYWPESYRYYNGDGVVDTPAHLKSSRSCSGTSNTCPDNVPGVDPGYVAM